MNADEEDFLARLEAVFPVEFPADLEFSTCDCGECGELRSEFEGLKWTEVPVSILEKHLFIGLLGKSVIRYYLPAFLRAGRENMDGNAIHAVMSLLEPSGLGREEIAKYTPEQRAIIVEWLNRLPKREDELEEWEKDLPPSKRWLKMLARWAP